MTIRAYWQIDPAAEPYRLESGAHHVHGQIRELRSGPLNRFDYYAQIAQAAAQTAFDGVFVAHRPEADESRIVAAALARETRRIELVAEFPASVGSAVYAAKQAATFQRGTHDRFAWAIAPDGDVATRAREADFVPDDQLDERVNEFLTVARGVQTQRPFSFKGTHFEVLDGGFDAPLNRVPFPRVFLQGESEEALDLSARQADVHLFGATAPARIATQVEILDTQAKRAGRSVAYGLLQPVLARETDEEAALEATRSDLAAGTLTGSYDTVAGRLAELGRAGISHFVLSAQPSLEEAYRIGQHVLPRLRAQLAPNRVAA